MKRFFFPLLSLMTKLQPTGVNLGVDGCMRQRCKPLLSTVKADRRYMNVPYML